MLWLQKKIPSQPSIKKKKTLFCFLFLSLLVNGCNLIYLEIMILSIYNFLILYVCLWVQEVCNPTQTLSGSRVRVEGISCQRRMIGGRGSKGNGWGLTLSSAFQSFNGKTNILVEAIPKQPPQGDVNGMGPIGKQGVKLDQGKCVPSSVNAPANTQSLLMRKDVWTV